MYGYRQCRVSGANVPISIVSFYSFMGTTPYYTWIEKMENRTRMYEEHMYCKMYVIANGAILKKNNVCKSLVYLYCAILVRFSIFSIQVELIVPYLYWYCTVVPVYTLRYPQPLCRAGSAAGQAFSALRGGGILLRKHCSHQIQQQLLQTAAGSAKMGSVQQSLYSTSSSCWKNRMPNFTRGSAAPKSSVWKKAAVAAENLTNHKGNRTELTTWHG